MQDETNNNFYREQYFQELSKNIADIKELQKEQSQDIGDIKARVSYIRGWAAGAGAVAGLIMGALVSLFYKVIFKQ